MSEGFEDRIGGSCGRGSDGMKTVAVIGMGLMGGSLGLALRRRGLARVRGYARRAETRQAALAMGAVDSVYETAAAAVQGAGIVVMCTPVLSIPALVNECLPALESGAVVTDVGSTKAELTHRLAPILAGGRVQFVGSHPMTGSEKTGIEVARADLYEGAVTVVTASGADGIGVDRVAAMWRDVGSRVMRLDPGEHDALVARTSHLPHLVASLLVTATAGGNRENFLALCGPGYRDTTRIAAGSPEMWHDIVKSNRAEILLALRGFQGELAGLIADIEAGNFDAVREQLERGREARQAINS